MNRCKSILGALVLGVFLSSCAHSEGNYFGAYSEAEKLYQAGKYEKAIVKYQEYLGTQPQGNMAAIAEYYIAKSHAALGEMAEAKAGFQRVIDRYPKTDWASFSTTQLESLDSKAQA